MRKLGGIEAISDFVLAVAGGADVNSSWRGNALVVHLFVEAMREIAMHPTAPPGTPRDANILKLKTVLCAGADATPLFRTGYEYYEIGNLLRLMSRQLELLAVLLENAQVRRGLAEDPDLALLGKRLERLMNVAFTEKVDYDEEKHVKMIREENRSWVRE